MEALYPGELATIVREALDPYVDEALEARLQDAAADAQDQVADLWEEQTAAFRDRLANLQADTQAIYARYTQELEAIKRRLDHELAPYAKALEELRHEVWAAQDDFARTCPTRHRPRSGRRMNPRGSLTVSAPMRPNSASIRATPTVRPVGTLEETTMPDPVFLHQLDEIGSRGCGTPFCTHDHLDAFALVARCHPADGVRVGFTDEVGGFPCDAVMQICCWTCHTEIVQVALTTPVTGPDECGHNAAADVEYQRGMLTLRCWHCQHEWGTMAAAPYVPA